MIESRLVTITPEDWENARNPEDGWCSSTACLGATVLKRYVKPSAYVSFGTNNGYVRDSAGSVMAVEVVFSKHMQKRVMRWIHLQANRKQFPFFWNWRYNRASRCVVGCAVELPVDLWKRGV